MDYKKKYEEVLERAKEIIECSKSESKEVRMVLSFFPELAESEGERIRKWIIENIQETLDVDGFFEGQKRMAKNAIAWLEEQGEQKPAMYSEEDKKLIRNLRSELSNLKVRKLIKEETYIKYVNLLNGILHQSCWKPSDEQMEALWNVYQGGKEQVELATLYNDLKKLREE